MINSTRIKARMTEAGVTQATLAKQLGLATSTVCQKINNARPLTLSEAEAMARALDISDAEFSTYFFAHNFA